MMTIAEALERCRQAGTVFQVPGNPFRLTCRLAPPATADELLTATQNRPAPDDVVGLWSISREGELFADVDYGQWGLRYLSPNESRRRSEEEREDRPEDIDPDDWIVAEFLGDQDLVIVNRVGDILIAQPLDSRENWARPASSLAQFFGDYVNRQGAKYWEPNPADASRLRNSPRNRSDEAD